MRELILEHLYKGGLWRVELVEWQGGRRISFWRFYADPSGNWLPTRQGFQLPVERLGELREALDRAAGLLEGEAL